MVPRKRSRRKRSSGILSTALGILFASVMAVFLGYVVGQIGIRAITKPLFTEGTTARTRAEDTRSTNQKANEPAPSTTSSQSVNSSSQPAPASAQPGSHQTTPSPASVSAPVLTRATVPATTPTPQRKPVVPADDLAVPALATPRPQEGNVSGTQESALWRVRVGRFANKAEADALLAQVKVYEPQAFLVREGTYRIQAGAFSDKARAEALQTELMRHGFAAELMGPTY